MTSSKRNIYILIALTLVFLIVFSVARIYLLCNYYNINEGLYKNDTPAVTLFNISFFVSCLVIGLLGFLIKNNHVYKKLPQNGNSYVFTGALCGFMFVSSLIIQCVYFLPGILKTAAAGQKILFIISLVLTIPSALYYFKCASTTKLSHINYKLLSFCPILWGVVYVIYMYFNTDTVMKSPERIMLQLAFICAMLFMTSEARFHIGEAKPKLHTVISLLSVLIIGIACIPSFALSAFWTLPFTENTVYAALLIALGAYILSNLPAMASEES